MEPHPGRPEPLGETSHSRTEHWLPRGHPRGLSQVDWHTLLGDFSAFPEEYCQAHPSQSL
jgi:hypothetical protein